MTAAIKLNLKMLFCLRWQYLSNRAKPRDITLFILHYRIISFSFYLKIKTLDNDVRGDSTIRSVNSLLSNGSK